MHPRSVLPVLFLMMCGGTLSAQGVFDIDYGGARSHMFDVLHVAIDVRFDEDRKEVKGSVSHRIRSLSDNLMSVRLDAGDSMRFNKVTVNGAPVRYQHRGEGLTIDLPSAPRRYDDTFLVAIDYVAYPQKGLYFIRPDSANPNRRHQIWTQGEAEDNRYWVPIYDYPNDRATSELRATVRSDWKVLSNGTLRSTADNGDGTKSWRWVMEKPHSSYLIMMAAGDYLVTHDTVGSIPLEYWSYPDMPDRVEPTFGRTADMIRYFEQLLGVPYPWDKYAQVMLSQFMYGGMENTTATTLADYLLIDARTLIDYTPDETIAHEIAHQWFGDLVTNRSWGHLWLHESFATYLAARYIGHHYGDDAITMEWQRNGLIALATEKNLGRLPIAGAEGSPVGNLYQRGSRVLNMLHEVVGEQAFLRSINLFLRRHAYGLVESNDLKIAFEDVTGLNLDWFFEQWIYKAGTPALAVDYTWGNDSLRLRVRQTQKRDSLTGLFTIPVPVEFHLGRGKMLSDTILVSKAEETFSFAVPSRPRFVVFDAGDHTLKTMEFQRSEEELLAQLESPRMIDRYHALRALPKDSGRAPKSRIAAIHDAYMRERSTTMREEFVRKIATYDSPLATQVVERAIADSSVEVRQAGVQSAYRIADKKRRAEMIRPLLSDSSYGVIGAAIRMISLTDTTGLEALLRSMKGVKGRRDRMAGAWLDAVENAKMVSLAEEVADYTDRVNGRETRAQAYRTLAKLGRSTPAIHAAIVRGLNDNSNLVRTAAVDAAKTLMDPELREMLEAARPSLRDEARAAADSLLK